MSNQVPPPSPAIDRTYFPCPDTLAEYAANLSLRDPKEEVDTHIYCQPKLHYQGNPTKFYVVNAGKSTGIWDDW
jgi:hypothetical protein